MTEKISQLIDHDLSPDQRERLFKKIINNSSASQCWSRYHLIGNVIRDEISFTGRDLSDQVAEKLKKEPTVLAPASVKESGVTTKSEVWKSAGLFAVAASPGLNGLIAYAKLVSGQQLEQ